MAEPILLFQARILRLDTDFLSHLSIEALFALSAFNNLALTLTIKNAGFATFSTQPSVVVIKSSNPKCCCKRLQLLKDSPGNTCAYCLELHDTAVSKLMAGREKDFHFITALLEKELISLETFVERAATIQYTASANALLPRLKQLQKRLQTELLGIDLS